MYQLIKSIRTPKGFISQTVKTELGEQTFLYYSIRFAIVFPTPKSPGYFVGAGEELYDQIQVTQFGQVLNVISECEHQGIDLDGLLDKLTDEMTASLSDIVYTDMTLEDHRDLLFGYMDKRNLRNLSALQAPYSNFVLRIGKVKDYDNAGDLEIDKGSPLFADLRGISRADLEDEPEIKFYRLNALSMLVSGFSKYRTTPVLDVSNFAKPFKPTPQGWMGH
jgi:hypothetical protein